MLRPTPRPTLFPYTTLFRSRAINFVKNPEIAGERSARQFISRELVGDIVVGGDGVEHAAFAWIGRSEEHTSELQSHSDVVCRLLLEKKKLKIHDRVYEHRLE